MFTEKFFIIAVVNIIIFGIFAYAITRKKLLSYFSGGRWWLTWFSIAIITLMDELSSIFYAPSEAWRHIGTNAIVYIAFTSLLMRFLSARMVEIAEILEFHGIRGGGVYSFSYLVLGPTISFIAVASIIVDYVLTASISTVSAVENGMAFFTISEMGKLFLGIGIIWFVAGLNILGIKENAKFTFTIFIIAAVILVNLLSMGFIEMNPNNWHTVGTSFVNVFHGFTTDNWLHTYIIIIISISSCILAYSGIESVVQTASLVRSWKEVGRAYIFLAVTTGLFTPLLAMLVLSSTPNIAEHETDLITQFARMVGGVPFGYIVGILASVILIMAVNTAYVASSELLERVAHRYGFHWIIKTNRRQSLYRIHIANGIFYTVLVIITGGSQAILAEMYAVGLVASFAINMGSLLIYRYFKGTKDVRAYNTSRTGTMVIFIILFSCLLYLMYEKPYGTVMWSTVTAIFLFIGLQVARKRAPELKEIQQTDVPLNMIFYLAEAETEHVHIHFRRPQEVSKDDKNQSSVYVSLYSPRQGIPEKLSPNHFRFVNQNQSIYNGIIEILYAIEYELPDKKVTVHFGWPLSSWVDRLSIGVMVFSIMRLPKKFPRFNFVIEYFGKKEIPTKI